MKTLVILTSTLFFSFAIIRDNPTNRIGVKGPLTFNATTFNLAWSDKPNDTYFIQEYLPEGEKPESFNQMLTIHVFAIDIKPQDAVKQKIKELDERKKTDPICKYMVTESPDGKKFMIDFLLGENKDNKMTTVEFNVYRYKQIKISRKKKGIVVYSYTQRSYGDSITPFFKSLKGKRIDYLNQMIKAEIPHVNIQD